MAQRNNRASSRDKGKDKASPRAKVTNMARNTDNQNTREDVASARSIPDASPGAGLARRNR
jgi:hypothetical protein